MPALALMKRILCQLKHDRRTLALLFVAPLVLLALVSYILNGGTTGDYTIAAVNCPVSYIERLEEQGVEVTRMSEAEAIDALYQGDIIATMTYVNQKMEIQLDGSNSSQSLQAVNAIRSAMQPSTRTTSAIEIEYVYGYEGLSMFDNFGSVLIGFFVFFFVFLIAGISFLQERTSGTLEKLLSMPIERWQIVVGYVLGFGLLSAIQALLITLFAIYVLHVMMIGNFCYVLLIAIMTSLCALTLGILLSTVANNEFQIIQFIPIVIVPQVFFSGLFALPSILEPIGHLMPLYYVANALTAVMIKGAGFAEIAGDLFFLLCCSIVFIALNTRVLKKYRDI